VTAFQGGAGEALWARFRFAWGEIAVHPFHAGWVDSKAIVIAAAGIHGREKKRESALFSARQSKTPGHCWPGVLG
ncbi:hypothetical protein, partial [Pseudomonas paraeruginosa]|uniref:hypothetical protein n=1 Tax=Pseudomonas paraeruginosa TaxID=2994495 RepID=UPI003748D575